MPPRLAVFGSLNMDFVWRLPHLPAPGETVLGHGFTMIPGGKGANQACAAARLGHPNVQASLCGRVGYDLFGDQLKASLAAAGVDVSGVHATRSQPTGTAAIWVDRDGRNSIAVAPGANGAFLPAEAPGHRAALRQARMALFQLETPIETVAALIQMARMERAVTMLDPAPARSLPPALLEAVDLLTPNESEARQLLGRAAGEVDLSEAPAIAAALLDLGPQAVVLKLGAHGCYYAGREGERIHMPGFLVKAVDTTAAGDIFNGALAVALAEDMPLPQALRRANAAAAISVTRAGAQTSIPTRAEVDRFLAAA